jgi:hypothetical protein
LDVFQFQGISVNPACMSAGGVGAFLELYMQVRRITLWYSMPPFILGLIAGWLGVDSHDCDGFVATVLQADEEEASRHDRLQSRRR